MFNKHESGNYLYLVFILGCILPLVGNADYNPDYVVETIYEADFDDEVTQAAWTRNTLNGSFNWDYGCPRSPGGTLSCDYAWFDSDAAGSAAGRLRARLESPVISAPSATGFRLFVEYDHMYRAIGAQTGSVAILNNGTWETIRLYNTTQGDIPAVGTTAWDELSGANAEDGFQVGFDFDDNGTWGWYWYISNMRVQALANIPGLSIAVSQDPIAVGESVVLTLSVDNTSNPIAIDQMALSIPLPEQLEPDATNPPVSDCPAGNLDLVDIGGTPTIVWADGSVAAESTCQLQVQLQGIEAAQVDLSGVLESPVGDSEPAEASLEILALRTIGGQVSGLGAAGVVLDLNALESLEILANGTFQFDTTLVDDDNYEVTVLDQPIGQTCVIENGQGTVSGTDVTDIDVECSTNTYTIGGTVFGLEGSGLELALNGDIEILQIADNGAFQFNTELEFGTDYTVTLESNPTSPSQTCTVDGGTGTVDVEDVTDIEITCSIDTFTIGGTVSGLEGEGLVLQNNGGDDLTIGADGDFAFATALADLSDYEVTVLTQPDEPVQTCTVANAAGTLAGDDVDNVEVTCSTDTFIIGGTVSGLEGEGLVLQNNGGDDLAINGDGDFTFTTPLTDLSGYEVAVLTQPDEPVQTCTVANAAGTLAGADVDNVEVTCSTDTFTVGGTVSGLEGEGLVLQNNGGDDLTIGADGDFAFATALADLSDYEVSVLTQPDEPVQTCTVENATGTLAGSDVADVDVICTTDTFTVGGTVSGLEGDGLVLQLNGDDDLTIDDDGDFTFATALADGSDYEVTVLTQPSDPSQTCQTITGSGTLQGEAVTDVAVTCATPALVLDTDLLAFGNIEPGTERSGEIRLTNNGEAPVTVSEITDPDEPFAVTGGSCLPVPTTLEPGEDCTIDVIYAAGLQTAQHESSFEIISDAPSSPDQVQLSGQSITAIPVPINRSATLMVLALMLLLAGWRRARMDREPV